MCVAVGIAPADLHGNGSRRIVPQSEMKIGAALAAVAASAIHLSGLDLPVASNDANLGTNGSPVRSVGGRMAGPCVGGGRLKGKP